MTRIALIDGHPDPDEARFVHALVDSYRAGAVDGGHEVRTIDLARLDIPLLRSRTAWESDAPPPAIAKAQETLAWAEHYVIFYPLWLGDMPALLKAFLEQALRPGFAIDPKGAGLKSGLLRGRSARLVVTMGMPAIFYRFYFGAHSVRSFERNILKLVGIRPVSRTLIGGVEGSAEDREKALDEVFELGQGAA